MYSIRAHAARLAAACALPTLLFAAGCGVKDQLAECQSRLSATQGENTRLEQDLADLRTDYKEVLRSGGILPEGDGSQTEAYMADVEKQIDLVKKNIQAEVPPLVREQLEKELGNLVSMLDQQFGELDSRYTQIRTQLDGVQGSLDSASQRLSGIEHTGGAIQTELTAQRFDEGRLEEVVANISKSIEDFDESRFLCRKCPEYLDLKRKRQDEIIAFHNQLRSELRRLPVAITRPAGEEEGTDEEPGESPEPPASPGR